MTSEPSTNKLFETDHLEQDFRGRTVRGGSITMVAEAVKFAITMGSLPVLARLLSPEDYGLIAMEARTMTIAMSP